MTRERKVIQAARRQAEAAWAVKFSGAHVVHRRMTREDWIEGYIAGHTDCAATWKQTEQTILKLMGSISNMITVLEEENI